MRDMDTKELKFSKMEYDTFKAKTLFREHRQFVGINFEATEEFVEDSVGNRICVSGPRLNSEVHRAADVGEKLWRLAELVRASAELICQLEYAVRGVRPDELKAYDLKLILQNIIYCASRTDLCPRSEAPPQPVLLRDHSPLVGLALAAQRALATGRVEVVAEKQTAVVGWLFIDLCVKAGFKDDEVALRFVKDADVSLHQSTLKSALLHIEELERGCAAVVAAASDLDSAVDVLADTPDRAPWRVKRILVQESVARRFRSSLEDKARRQSGGAVDEVLLRQSTGGCRYGRKTFLFDFVGGEEGTAQGHGAGVVLVEAYRTVRELLALLNNFKPYAISVWADSVAESSEISHGAPSPVIWINSYGNFDGPPQVSQSFFSFIEASISDKDQVNIVEPRNLLELWKCWSSLSQHERAAKLQVHKHNARTDDSFCYVSDKFVCAGTERPLFFYLLWSDISDIEQNKHNLLEFAAKGGCVLLLKDEKYPKTIVDLVDAMRSVDAPVGWVSRVGGETSSKCVEAVQTFLYRRKVVWTSYGTIFSN